MNHWDLVLEWIKGGKAASQNNGKNDDLLISRENPKTGPKEQVIRSLLGIQAAQKATVNVQMCYNNPLIRLQFFVFLVQTKLKRVAKEGLWNRRGSQTHHGPDCSNISLDQRCTNAPFWERVTSKCEPDTHYKRSCDEPHYFMQLRYTNR